MPDNARHPEQQEEKVIANSRSEFKRLVRMGENVVLRADLIPCGEAMAMEAARQEGYRAGLEKAAEIADAFMRESTKEAVEFGEPASSWGKVAAAGLIALAIRAALKSGPDTPNREGE
jgi:hypothetical protein